jgi:dephospho-CoA kinase
MNMRAPLVLGLLGGIGSGKSAVAAEFARRGARIIAADQFGHEALRQPAVRDAIVRRWGEGVLDAEGQIDRRKVAAIVFRDEAERRALEGIVHPYIRRRIEQEVARAREENARLIVLDAAVLLEAGWDNVCDRLVYVEAPRELRQARVTGKRGWTTKDWEDRELAQLTLTEKHARADHVISNSSTLEHLGRQVEELLRHWGLAPAASPEANVSPDATLTHPYPKDNLPLAPDARHPSSAPADGGDDNHG